MKPAPFKYLAAESLQHALELKAQHGEEARFLAGGQSLLPAMNFRLAQPGAIIDLNALAPLDYANADPTGAFRVGALTRYRTLERSALVARHQPLLYEAIPNVAHPQIRNRGTLCGNLANADPASELPAVMLASGARMRVQSVRGERWVDAKAFFTGVYATALAADEMLVEVEMPALPPRSGTCFLEVARRRGDFAMMGVAAIVTFGGDGKCSAAALAYCNAGSTPMAAARAAQSLVGARIGETEFAAAAALAQQEIDPPGSVQAGKPYQRQLAAVLTRRALAGAAARALA